MVSRRDGSAGDIPTEYLAFASGLHGWSTTLPRIVYKGVALLSVIATPVDLWARELDETFSLSHPERSSSKVTRDEQHFPLRYGGVWVLVVLALRRVSLAKNVWPITAHRSFGCKGAHMSRGFPWLSCPRLQIEEGKQESQSEVDMQIIRLFRAVKTTVRWQYEEYQHRKRQRKAWQDTIRTIDQYMAEAREKRFRYSEAGLTKAVLRMHRFELRLVFAKEICVAMLSR